MEEWEAAEVLWTEWDGSSYHENETLDDAWERLFRERCAQMPILEMNMPGYLINKYNGGRYMKLGINCPDQIRLAKPQS